MNEKEAVKRVQQGQMDGLAVLVQLHQSAARRTAFLVCHDESLAEDVVQNAFIRVYERISQFDENRAFAPWFNRIVVNDTLTAVSRRGSVSLESQPVSELPTLDPGLYERLEAAETREAIWQTLEKLSPAQRAVIVLRYYYDLSDQEISVALDCPPGTVRRRLHDARQRLRKLLPGWVRPG